MPFSPSQPPNSCPNGCPGTCYSWPGTEVGHGIVVWEQDLINLSKGREVYFSKTVFYHIFRNTELDHVTINIALSETLKNH